MSKFKVGQRVMTSTGDGSGEIVKIEEDLYEYGITVLLDSGGPLGYKDEELEAVK